MLCPRRAELPPMYLDKLPPEDSWRSDGCCSHCGSINPATLIARIEAGDVELGPTDKNYKVYVRNAGGAPFLQTHRTDSKPFAGWDSPEHTWETREIGEAKFYFQHFDATQRHRFIELLNARRVKIGYPGRFYVLPFFAESHVEPVR